VADWLTDPELLFELKLVTVEVVDAVPHPLTDAEPLVDCVPFEVMDDDPDVLKEPVELKDADEEGAADPE